MLNPHYVTGFVDGEGCFAITISKIRFKVAEVRLKFEIELREDDEPILKEIQKTLDCGSIYRLEYERYKKWRPHVKFMVGSFRDIKGKVIPFFKKYPPQAKKKYQFDLFCKVAEMMDQKVHLTEEGIEQIRSLREALKMHKDSLDAREGHVQWGVE
jgi:hypothetical protein